MSDTSTTLSDAHFAYIAARTPGDDAFLTSLKAAAAEAGLPSIWIAPEQASFLQVLLRACRCRDVVEVGTLAGYSAIAMARALPDGGTLRTIEFEPKHADFAEAWIRRSDVASKVTVHRGDGRSVLADFADASADAMFIDADKAGYETYFRHALRIVRPGGLILCDNALAFGHVLESESTDASVKAVQRFNEVVAKEPAVHGVIVPIGDGVWVCVKR
jgi:caffeoyl-CoA O-methyltransferase